MIKMIVSDMDGTLLNSQKQLPINFESVYHQLQKLGIYFVVASGRQYHALASDFSGINHSIIFAAENGGFIKTAYGAKVVKPFVKGELSDIIQLCRAIPGIEVVLCGEQSSYVESSDKTFLSEVRKYYYRCDVVDDLLEVEDAIMKIAVCCTGQLAEKILPQFVSRATDYSISISGEQWIDVMPNGINKGNAIKALQMDLGVKPEETMVFGDYLNDLEMMETAKYSYAMANAHPKLKEVAKYLTDSNDDNGVINMVCKQLSQINGLELG